MNMPFASRTDAMGPLPGENPHEARAALCAAGAVLAALAMIAWCAPPGTAWAIALVTLVPAAALGLGGAIFAVSQLRHRDEIVIQRGPERP